jgi:hypothetical protein
MKREVKLYKDEKREAFVYKYQGKFYPFSIRHEDYTEEEHRARATRLVRLPRLYGDARYYRGDLAYIRRFYVEVS